MAEPPGVDGRHKAGHDWEAGLSTGIAIRVACDFLILLDMEITIRYSDILVMERAGKPGWVALLEREQGQRERREGRSEMEFKWLKTNNSAKRPISRRQ